MSPQNINLDETVPARVLPFQNAVSFLQQPFSIDERVHQMSLMILSAPAFGATDCHPKPRSVPAHATAFKFNGLWFWGWDS